RRRSASARISTGLEIWSSGSSTRSSIVGEWQPATTSSRPTTSHSSNLRRSGYGCALMSPRPNKRCTISLIKFWKERSGLVKRAHRSHPRITAGELLQRLKRSIRAAIVGKHKLPLMALRNLRQRAIDRFVQRLDIALLVVDGHNDGEELHGLNADPLKA